MSDNGPAGQRRDVTLAEQIYVCVSDWEQAEAMHKEAVALVRGALN